MRQDTSNEAKDTESNKESNIALELVHVLDDNNNSVQLLNGLAWPKVEAWLL